MIKIYKNKRTGRNQVHGFYVKSINIDFYKVFWALLSLISTGFAIWLWKGLFQRRIVGYEDSILHWFPITKSSFEFLSFRGFLFIVSIIVSILIYRQAFRNRWRKPSYRRIFVPMCLLSLVVWLLTLRGDDAFAAGWGIVLVGIVTIPSLLFFIVKVLITKAIWKR